MIDVRPGAQPQRQLVGIELGEAQAVEVVRLAAPDRAKAEPYCAEAALIVIDDASAGGTCKGQPVRVVTRRDLARAGGSEPAGP